MPAKPRLLSSLITPINTLLTAAYDFGTAVAGNLAFSPIGELIRSVVVWGGYKVRNSNLILLAVAAP